MQLVNVIDERGLARDPVSKAILRTDIEELAAHRRRVRAARQQRQDSERITQLEAEVAELKQLVHQLLATNK